MVSGKYSALAGAVSREQALANISNNLANVNTSGYKKMLTSFESILKSEKQNTDARGINYNRVSNISTDFSQGPLKETGNTFDLAIHGKGFFKLQGPDAVYYTRSGSFKLAPNGGLVSQDGYPVLDEGNTPLEVIAAGARISISGNGQIVALDDQGNREEIGRVAVVDIETPELMKRKNNTSFYLEQGGQELPLEEVQVVSGSLEMSNVNMIDEMARMINGSRLYETYHKVLKGYSTIGEKLDELGTVS